MLRPVTLLLLPLFLLVKPTDTLATQPLQAQETIRSQWEASPHAGSLDTPDEQVRMNRPGCAHCHTAQGYEEVVLKGLESTAPYTDPVGLTCEACHMASEGEGDVGPLKAGATREACRGCHDELVSNRPDDLSWCSQWGIFDGTGGVEIPGREYGTGTHAGLDGGCVACHMASPAPDSDPLLLGGHTFRVKTKGDLPPAFNPGPCRPCHGSMTIERLTADQGQVRGLLAELASLLPLKPDPADPSATEPRYPADPSLDETEARASYNYWLVQKDGSFGVHNPVYTRDLLEHSIADLKGKQASLTSGRTELRRDSGSEAVTQIDHVIWAVPSLEEGVDFFRRMSGVDPAVGGVHPGRGTRNSLVSAGRNTYLEIIAPDPSQMPLDPDEYPVQAFAHEISGMEGPEVDMFAFSSSDLEAVAEKGRELGLTVVGPTPGERMTSDGVLIRWSHVDFIDHGFGQFLPFALNWLDSPHPSTTSPKGVVMEGITVEHPRAEALRRIYVALGVPAEVVFAEEPRIIVRMRSDNGPFEITSGESLLAYYAARSTVNIR